jgi:anti-sigma regulatory factor (Ser/Thr protein kinase)
MIMDMAAHSMCCRLSRESAQVRHAREQARKALVRWGLGEHADLAELIVSELATNAIRHGEGVVHVCVSFARGDLRVEVHDDAPGRRPVRKQAAAEDESGRGLALLDGLIGLHGGSRGVAHDSTGRRKTVYVMICLAADPASRSSADGLLPNQALPRGAPSRTDAPVREGLMSRWTREEILNGLPDVISQITGVPSRDIGPATSIADDLQISPIAGGARFGLKIPKKDTKTLRTTGDLTDYVFDRRS